MKDFQNLFDRDEGKDAWMCSWEGSNLNKEKELVDRKEVLQGKRSR